MEKRVNNPKTDEGKKYSEEEIQDLIKDTYERIDWEELNNISAKIQTRAGVKEIKKIFPPKLVFANLGHGRVFQVNHSHKFTITEELIRYKPSADEDVEILCDFNFFLDDRSNWYSAPVNELKHYITESIIHEYVHIISNNSAHPIHSSTTEENLAHTVLRSGVKEVELYGKEMKPLKNGGRLNEVLTEYVAELIQKDYYSEYNQHDLSKRLGSYDSFKFTFKFLLVALHKATGVEVDKIKNAFLVGYFTDQDIMSENFVSTLPEDIRYAYLEILKSETDNQNLMDYTYHLIREYKITIEDMDGL